MSENTNTSNIIGNNNNNMTPKTTTTKDSKKKVTFCKRVKTRRIIQRRDAVSTGVKEDCWYNNDDYEFMRKQAKEVADRLDVSQSFYEQVLWSRGLETSDMRHKRHSEMRRSRRAVLLEQEQQRDDGDLQPHVIARKASKISKKSAEAARKRGAITQEHVWKEDGGNMSDDSSSGSSSSRSTKSNNTTTNKRIQAPGMRNTGFGVSYDRRCLSTFSQSSSSFCKRMHLSALSPRL